MNIILFLNNCIHADKQSERWFMRNYVKMISKWRKHNIPSSTTSALNTRGRILTRTNKVGGHHSHHRHQLDQLDDVQGGELHGPPWLPDDLLVGHVRLASSRGHGRTGRSSLSTDFFAILMMMNWLFVFPLKGSRQKNLKGLTTVFLDQKIPAVCTHKKFMMGWP